MSTLTQKSIVRFNNKNEMDTNTASSTDILYNKNNKNTTYIINITLSKFKPDNKISRN